MVTAPNVPPPSTNPSHNVPAGPSGPGSRPGLRLGWVVAGSLVIGLLAALLLVAAPFIRAQESEITGAVLCGFALGWALLAGLSVRFTGQPQRWALAPALVMGVGGLLLVIFGSPVRGILSWVWPPVLLVLAVWMIFRARRKLHSWSRAWLLYPVIVLLALASIGAGYETVREAADAQAYPMPGQLIDVGGHGLHLSCIGSGSPTVVLEPGGGEMSSNMGWIAPAVARDSRVCVYDRAGRGWSESADTPQDATQIATDLHTLLRRGQVQGPYVLAGHSFGGLYVLTFAARYPDEVAGMVLVDSTAPASAAKPRAVLPAAGSYDIMGRAAVLVSTSARLGLARLYALFDSNSLPQPSGAEVSANTATAGNLRSTIDEYLQANDSMEQAATLKDFMAKPLVVLTAPIGSDSKHLAAQNDLAALSTNAVHRTVDGASHEALVADQTYAAITSEAILDVVSSVRTSIPLAR
ncbi:MAG: alpha/beta hydrolase fold protein [Micrococcaceae bacterium]|nr:alpha/beta hydrolase fold protein [Micrococcaceae bacterium]